MTGSPKRQEPLAHSAHDGAPEQTYCEHVGNVWRDAMLFAGEAAAFSPKWREAFLAVVDSASAYHDLGKLDEVFQDVLRHNRRTNRGFKHWDAGSAHLLCQKSGEAAAIVFAHHIGLPNYKHQINNDKFRDYSEIENVDLTIAEDHAIELKVSLNLLAQRTCLCQLLSFLPRECGFTADRKILARKWIR